MAVYTNESSRVSLKVQTGTDIQGNPEISSLNLRDVDPAALADDVVAVSAALGAVLAYPVVETLKIDTDMAA